MCYPFHNTIYNFEFIKNLTLTKGIVSTEDVEFVARQLRFNTGPYYYEIPKYIFVTQNLELEKKKF